MSIRIREARVEDAGDVCAVHVSDVSAWSRIRPDGSRESADYASLSPLERFRHGGPWMDPPLCARHLYDLRASGQKAWVAEEAETAAILGELETLRGPDPELGDALALDVLVVRSDRRREGVGRALVTHAIDEAVRSGVPEIVVSADPGALDFYRGLGFRSEIARVRGIELELEAERSAEPTLPFRPVSLTESFDPLRERPLVLGGYPPSFAVWWKRRWPVPGVTDELRVEEAEVDALRAFYRLERWIGHEDGVNLVGWASSRISTESLLRHAAVRARALGFARLWTMTHSGGPPIAESFDVRAEAETPILALGPP
jgi:GNAT superfamily N-acetyltransferase